MSHEREAELVGRLQALGTAVYSSLNLTSLVRLDIRADENGELYILEANPKPDLKRPSATSTSLVCTGLADQLGWGYEDLMACCFVERLWQLEQAKPHMLAYFLPAGVRAADLLQLLPERVAQVLTAAVSPQRQLSSKPSLQEQLGLAAFTAAAASFSAAASLSRCFSGLLALTRSGSTTLVEQAAVDGVAVARQRSAFAMPVATA